MPNPRVQAVSRLLHRTVGHTHKKHAAGMIQRASQSKPPVISTQSVDFKAPHSAKSEQAWKYPGGQIVRAPSTNLGGRNYTDPKNTDKPRRKHESNFFITINTNKSPKTPLVAEEGVKRLEDTLQQLSDETNVALYLKFGPKDAAYEEDKYSDVIHSLDWKAAVETGDVQKRLHAHIWLTISHYSQIQINVQMLMHLSRKIFNAGLQLGSPLRIVDMPYIHVKLLPQGDWTTVMRQYIHKGMTSVG
ncbi:hypothetical protein [Pleurochrysis sp. endemic virus 1a]|nr:hypothetical protein [Pleurochrysis sp. endemic virus 1a]|mmetsp:Transcript_29429/g.64472  ORF Transcript_29429/g.64472 Transcript_29429/m.64472 type:complete len:246 (-) Transcript_29429:1689-2426(-)